MFFLSANIKNAFAISRDYFGCPAMIIIDGGLCEFPLQRTSAGNDFAKTDRRAASANRMRFIFTFSPGVYIESPFRNEIIIDLMTF